MKLFISNVERDSDWIKCFDNKAKEHGFEIVEDEKTKEECDFFLYVITPKMKGIGDIVNAVDDSNFHTAKTIFCVLNDAQGNAEFNPHQKKSLEATGKMIERNGGKWFNQVEETIAYLESVYKV